MNEKIKSDLSNLSVTLLRLATPVMVALSLWILTDMNAKVAEINSRLYLHQTNHEIHVPRAELVEIKAQMREQMREIIGVIKSESNRR